MSIRLNLTPIVIAIVLTLTAIPFEFRFPSLSDIEMEGERGDLIRNLILFLPVGFFLSHGLLSTLILGIVVSISVEACQLFSADRVPQLPDIATNMIGTAAGWLLARSILGSLTTKGRTIPIPRLMFVLSIVVGLMLSLTMFPRSAKSDLSNWEPTFQMKVGGESGGQPDWRGSVSAVTITNGAMSADEIAKRAARGPGDLRRTLPNSDPELFRKITESGQFTVLLWGSTDDLKQKGPARIVTWSRNISASNLTIGQDGPRIVLRIRTPATNAIGGRPETRTVPVLEARRVFFVAATYDGVVARVFINGVEVAENNLSVKYSLSGLPGLTCALLSGFLLALGSRWFLPPSFPPVRLSIGMILAGTVALAASGWGLPPAPTLRFVALFTAGVLIASASVQASGSMPDISD